MKTMLLIILSALSIGAHAFVAQPDTGNSFFVEWKPNGIVIEDNILLVATPDQPGQNVTALRVYDASNNLVSVETSCDGGQCEADISSLTPGTYRAEADVSQGSMMNENFVKS